MWSSIATFSCNVFWKPRPITGLETRGTTDSAEHDWCGQSYITQPSREYLHHTSIVILALPTRRISTCHGFCPEDPSLPGYTQAACWTDRGCPDLHDFEQPQVDSPCRLMELPSAAATARPGPRTTMVPRAPYWLRWSWLSWRPWNEHNTRLHAGPASLPPAVHPGFRAATPFGG